MAIPLQEALMVIGGAASITTAIFLGAFYLGKLWARMERIEQRVDDHISDRHAHERA